MISKITSADNDIPWWSILIFIDEPRCPKSLLKKLN